MISSPIALERIRDSLVEDQAFITWCITQFGKPPTIIIGDDPRQRPKYDEVNPLNCDYPLISIVDWNHQRGSNQADFQYSATLHFVLYNAAITTITRGINTPTFTGSGLNDLVVSGTYLDSHIRRFIIQASVIGLPDTMQWSSDGGTTWHNGELGIMPDPTPIGFGVFMHFGATHGHTLNDRWEFYCSPAKTGTLEGMVQVEALREQAENALFRAKILPTLQVAGGYDDTSDHPWHESYTELTNIEPPSKRKAMPQ